MQLAVIVGVTAAGAQLLATLLGGVPLAWSASPPSAQRKALRALYEATDGMGWTNKTGWLGGGDPCAPPWFGLKCKDGMVVQLDSTTRLNSSVEVGNSMGGTLPSQLSFLKELQVLSFSDNQISGTIPTELMTLTGMLQLYLINHPPEERDVDGYHSAAPLPMSGTIPTELAALEGLMAVAFQDTSLSGTLPVELANLSKVSKLYVDYNFISGTIGSELGTLSAAGILNLESSFLSGTFPPQLGEMRELTQLLIGSTFLSGVIPPQVAKLSEMIALVLYNNSISGSVPPELALPELSFLILNSNPLSGTIPSELAHLDEMQAFDLGQTLLSGTLPSVSSSHLLDLSDMRLSGSVPASLLRRCLPFGDVECSGLPPFSCSAFDPDHSRLSLTSFSACIRCPSHDATVDKVVLYAVLLPLAVGLYIWAVGRFPKFKTWIASASIFVNQLQVVGLLSSLTSVRIVSPGGTLAVLQAALVVCIDVGTVNPQCLFPPGPDTEFHLKPVNSKGGTEYIGFPVFHLRAFLMSPTIIGTVTAIALPTIAFFVIMLAKFFVEKRNRTNHKIVDMLENWAVIIFTLQLPTVCRIGFRTTVLGAYGNTHYPLWVGVPILMLELAYAIRLLRHVRATQGLRSRFGWRSSAQSSTEPISVAPAEPIGVQGSVQQRLLVESPPSSSSTAPGCMDVTLPITRLDDRLQYLTGRYKPEAPYWQFVLWARQLAIIGITIGFETYDETAMVLVEAGATFAVLAATLWLHCRVRPYHHDYQNIGEVVLTSLSMLAITVGCAAYWQRVHLTEVSNNVFGAALLGMLLGPVVVFAIYAGVEAHRIKRELLIYHCSPKVAPLNHARSEAADVKRVYGDDAVAVSGTSESLHTKLKDMRPTRFLFTGHTDAQLEEGKFTLAFADDEGPEGRLDVVRSETLVNLFHGVREGRDDVLELVFLNGCKSEELGRAIREDAKVPWVVCWRTECDDEAARAFSTLFFEELSRVGALDEVNYRAAFDLAKSALESGQKCAGTLANRRRTPAQVPKFVFGDPKAPTVPHPTVTVGVPLLLGPHDLAPAAAPTDAAYSPPHSNRPARGLNDNTSNENDSSDARCFVTGPQTVQQEATAFPLKVWVMIDKDVEEFRKLIQGQKNNEELTGAPGEIENNVAELSVHVNVEGCDPVEPTTRSVRWRRKIVSSSHIVRIPPAFASGSFVCTVTIEDPSAERDRTIFDEQFVVERRPAHISGEAAPVILDPAGVLAAFQGAGLVPARQRSSDRRSSEGSESELQCEAWPPVSGSQPAGPPSPVRERSSGTSRVTLAVGALRASGYPVLRGSAILWDVPTGLCTTAAHVLLDCAHVAGALDPRTSGVAIGVGSADSPIRWLYKAEIVSISFPPKQSPNWHPATIEAWSATILAAQGLPQLDFAVLRIVSEPSKPLTESFADYQLAALPFGDSNNAPADSPVRIYGFGQSEVAAAALDNSDRAKFTGGKLSSKSSEVISVDATMLGGHSGGMLLDAAGTVIGWCVSSQMDRVDGGDGRVPAGVHDVRPIELLRPALGAALIARPGGSLEEKLQGTVPLKAQR